jgi:hypothetical protein
MIDPGPSRRDHSFGDVLGTKAGSLQVDVEHTVPVGLGHLEKGDAREDPGVVDQDVNRAEPILAGGHHCLHLPNFANVSLDQDRASSASVYLLCHTLGGALVIEPVDRDIGPDCGELQRHRTADALLRPRDQDHLASETHVETPDYGRLIVAGSLQRSAAAGCSSGNRSPRPNSFCR